MKDSIGDRMKLYEKSTEVHLLKRSVGILRIDLRAGHTFCKHMEKPFDTTFKNCMLYASINTAKEIQGFKLAYTQSDEASFMFTDYDDINTCGWFDYDRDKIISIGASTFTKYFNKCIVDSKMFKCQDFKEFYKWYENFKGASFDARAFNVPRDDVANYFLWRCKDWHRNSLQMYARSVFTHKQLHGKCSSDIHEMLHKIGKNWAVDVEPKFKNGTFIVYDENNELSQCNCLTTYNDIYNVIIGYV